MPRSREILLPWDRQPQEAVEVNASLNAFCVINPAVGNRNLVSGVAAASAAAYAAVGREGRNFTFSGSQTQDAPALYPTSGNFTSFTIFSSTDVTQTQAFFYDSDGTSVSNYNGFGNPNPSVAYREVHFGVLTSKFNVTCQRDTLVGNANVSGTTTLVNNTIYVGCMRANGTTLSCFLNGAKEADLTNSTVAGSTPATLYRLANCGDTTANRYLRGSLYQHVTILGALSDSEIADISRALYASIYAPQTIWVPVSAGGGATNLIVQEALHSHAADNLGLTLDTFLAVQESLHAHTADNLALTLDTFLLLQDASHAHAADNITLSTGAVADLVVQEALHAHTADALVLTLDTFLVIQEAAHAHGADNIAFTLDSLLAIQEALHGHLADNLILSIPGSALSDAEFRQMYDWISELHLVHGLRAGSPLTVTPTTRAAGTVDQTIGEVGTTVTVTRI